MPEYILLLNGGTVVTKSFDFKPKWPWETDKIPWILSAQLFGAILDINNFVDILQIRNKK